MLRVCVTPDLQQAIKLTAAACDRLPLSAEQLSALSLTQSSKPDGASSGVTVHNEDTQLVPVTVLRAVAVYLKHSRDSGGKFASSSLRSLLKDSKLVFPGQSKRSDAACKRRQDLLRQRAEQREYERMVANVDPAIIRKTQHKIRSGVSLRNASSGLHIIVGMACGFIVGYMISRHIGSGSETVRIVGGAVAMTGTLLVEVALFIIRAQREEKLSTKHSRVRR